MPVNYDENGQRIIRPGLEVQWTQKMIQHYAACAKSVEYFATQAVKVQHPVKGIALMEHRDYQIRMLDVLEKSRRSIILAPRQCGKCCLSSTKINVRNKTTGIVEEIEIGEFYEKVKNSKKT